MGHSVYYVHWDPTHDLFTTRLGPLLSMKTMTPVNVSG